jgi:hypothetical protein
LADSNPNDTIDMSASDSLWGDDEQMTRDDFALGARWALRRLAEWLEKTTIVGDDEATQRGIDQAKMLIAAQAKQAAVDLRLNAAKSSLDRAGK